MVVLRLGGLYADIDCECIQPFDQLIRPRDTMLVAWENEFSTAEEASRRAYVRKRQVGGSCTPVSLAAEGQAPVIKHPRRYLGHSPWS